MLFPGMLRRDQLQRLHHRRRLIFRDDGLRPHDDSGRRGIVDLVLRDGVQNHGNEVEIHYFLAPVVVVLTVSVSSFVVVVVWTLLSLSSVAMVAIRSSGVQTTTTTNDDTDTVKTTTTGAKK